MIIFNINNTLNINNNKLNINNNKLNINNTLNINANLELVDDVVFLKQLVSNVLEGVSISYVVDSEHVERPFIEVLIIVIDK